MVISLIAILKPYLDDLAKGLFEAVLSLFAFLWLQREIDNGNINSLANKNCSPKDVTEKVPTIAGKAKQDQDPQLFWFLLKCVSAYSLLGYIGSFCTLKITGADVYIGTLQESLVVIGVLVLKASLMIYIVRN